MDKPIAWYDPTNGAVSRDKDSPLFTPLGQVLPLYTKQEDGRWTPERLAGMARLKAQQDSRLEPVACADNGVVNWIADKQFMHEAELYIAPPQRTWVGLTDEEIWTVLQFRGYNSDTIEIAKAIEAKLKEKNT